ncbi:MAG: GerW family sporulation protein [Lachnospiraceae bacterium]|nr:GerW family sporulation protein [Lachnospiraceae bacterium]
MAKDNEAFQSTIQSLFSGMDNFLSTKTVVGEPIQFGDTTIVPLVNVSFGVGAGAFYNDKHSNGGGGMGGKMTPTAILVMKNGNVRLMNVSTHSGMEKLLDMVPDFVDGFLHKDAEDDQDARAKAAECMEETIIDQSEFEDL